MPVNVVKTPRQEHLWNKAKSRAEAEGKGKDWAYVMGIFKHMGGLDKSACVMLDVLSKEAGWVGKVIGKNVGKAEKAVEDTAKQIKHTKDTMNNAKGWFGRKFSDSKTRKALKSDYKNLKGLKNEVKTQKKETFKARAKGVVGLGVAGAGVAGAKTIGDQYAQNRNYGNNDELKPQYLASEDLTQIEKIATLIVKEASLANLKASAKGVYTGVKNFLRPSNLADVAAFRRSRVGYHNLDAVAAGNNPLNSPMVAELNRLGPRINTAKANNTHLQGEIDELTKIPKNEIGAHFDYLDNVDDEEIVSNAKEVKKKVERLQTLLGENNKVLQAAESRYKELHGELKRVAQNEAGISGLLWGVPTAATAYGINKFRKKQKT